jgi:glycolate oxidase iron-sulfur subunit
MTEAENKFDSRSKSTVPTDEPCACAAEGVISPGLLAACIHCGLCLPSCPSYLATGRESESPRGRLHLLKLWQQGDLPCQPRLAEHIHSCLACLGCQTACPSGVQYGKILEQAKVPLKKFVDRKARKLMSHAFSNVLPDYARLRTLGKMLRFYQQAKLNRFLPQLPISGKLKARLARWDSFLPPVPDFKALPSQSWQPGEKKGQVQLFYGCVMDIFYNQVNHAAIRLLTGQKLIVSTPEQTCCGALALHAGEIETALSLARRNIEYFEKVQGDIVVTSAGCGAMLKEYGRLLEDDPLWAERAREFSARVKDICEALAAREFRSKPGRIEKKVAYHASCHLYNVQKIREAPLSLLKQIPGLTLVPLPEAEICCGSAGIYNLLHTDLSLKILARKMTNLKATGAQAVVTTNPGCLLQLEAGIKEHGLDMKAYHLVELLDEAFAQPGD